MAFRREHFLSGKEFNEKELRLTLGLPPVERPELLMETPERRRLVRLDDQVAKRELEEAERVAKEAAERARQQAQEQELKDARIAQLEAQLAEMRARLATETGAPVVTGAVAPNGGPAIAPPGTPNESWTTQQMVHWLDEHGLPVPPRKGFGMTKMAVLEWTLEQGRLAGLVEGA